MIKDSKKKSTSSGSMEGFREKCGEHGLKITPQRVAIYKELARAREHPSADLIYKKLRREFPNISFDTVNRTLLTFSKIGIIHVVEGYGQPKRFDPNTESHHHFRCVRCNSIVDFYSKAYDDMTVPQDILKRFTVLHKKVVLQGLCGKCS